MAENGKAKAKEKAKQPGAVPTDNNVPCFNAFAAKSGMNFGEITKKLNSQSLADTASKKSVTGETALALYRKDLRKVSKGTKDVKILQERPGRRIHFGGGTKESLRRVSVPFLLIEEHPENGVEYSWREAVFDVVKGDIMMLFGKDTLAAHRLVPDCEDDVLLDKNNGLRKVLNSTSEPMTGLIGLDMLGLLKTYPAAGAGATVSVYDFSVIVPNA